MSLTQRGAFHAAISTPTMHNAIGIIHFGSPIEKSMDTVFKTPILSISIIPFFLFLLQDYIEKRPLTSPKPLTGGFDMVSKSDFSNICPKFTIGIERSKVKQRLIISAYWTLTVILTATVLKCIYFTFAESLLVGILLLPTGLIVKFTFPKILEQPPRRKILDLCLLAVTVCIIACLLFVIGFAMVSDGHYFQEDSYTGVSTLPIPDGIAFPALLTVTAILFSIGDWYLVGFLSRKMPQEPVSITFTSDRKPVKLLQSDILYVESNDDETWVHTIDGRKFRNKTPISQWENLLGMDFIRIHRAFVVAKAHILSVKSDALTLDTKQELPVSRKYRSIIK